MGWYASMPFMECYHGVVSFGHGLAGTLERGRAGLFDGGRGYLEKDWGRAFPAAYVWLHSNHIARARRPASSPRSRSSPGCAARSAASSSGCAMTGELYRLATYTGPATTWLDIDDAHVRWTLRSRRAPARAGRRARRGGLLHAPLRTQMHHRVEETLDGRVAVRLADASGRVLLEDVGTAPAWRCTASWTGCLPRGSRRAVHPVLRRTVEQVIDKTKNSVEEAVDRAKAAMHSTEVGPGGGWSCQGLRVGRRRSPSWVDRLVVVMTFVPLACAATPGASIRSRLEPPRPAGIATTSAPSARSPGQTRQPTCCARVRRRRLGTGGSGDRPTWTLNCPEPLVAVRDPQGDRLVLDEE